jgi:hypothetical protein
MLEMQAGNQQNSAKKIYTKNEMNAPFSNPMGDYTLLMRGDDSFDFSALLCRRGSAGEFSEDLLQGGGSEGVFYNRMKYIGIFFGIFFSVVVQ